jgi:hypothetical protein
LNPNLPTAFVDSAFSRREDNALQMQADLQYLRFLWATFCIDGHSLLEDIQSGRLVVTDVATSGTNPGWVSVTCSINQDPADGMPASKGRLVLALSPAEDWAIREYEMTVEPPYDFGVHVEVATDRLAGGGIVPGEYRAEIVGQPDSERTPKQAVLYRMQDIQEVATVDDHDFTLAALGVREPSRTVSPIAVAIALVVTLMAIYAIYRVRTPERPKSELGSLP